MVHEGRVDAAVFAQLLKRLVKGKQRKPILVVNGHSIHRAKLLQHKLIELESRVELVFLPPYSPQFTPGESVWARVKQKIGKQIVLGKNDLLESMQAALAKLATMPQAVMAIFGQPDFHYAAETEWGFSNASIRETLINYLSSFRRRPESIKTNSLGAVFASVMNKSDAP